MPKKNQKQKKELNPKKAQNNFLNKITTTQENKQSTNRYLEYILRNQKNILLGVLLISLFLPLTISTSANSPLLNKSESYFHLSQSQQFEFQNPNYIALYVIQKILPLNTLIIIPIILSILNLFLLQRLLKKLNFPENFTFFFTLFLIISPTMILHSSNLTSTILFIGYTLLGFTLLTHEKKQWKYYAILPLALASLFNPFFTIFLLLMISIYTTIKHKTTKENTQEKDKSTNRFSIALILLITGVLILQLIFSNFSNFSPQSKPQSIFPTFIQKTIQQPNLGFVSDLGSESGISIFILFLAIIGMTITWKKTNYYLAYITLPLIATFFLNTQTIILLTIITTFFATIGFLKLLEMEWQIPTLKQFTLLILILGLTFSTLSYINRINQIGPTQDDFNTLTWIQENTPSESIILSDPKNSEVISYFAKRQPFITLNEIDQDKIQNYHQIIQAKYITDLFPLLDQNNITFIYLNQHTKEDPKYNYLIFLLKNERFKLVHSSKEAQVWVYNKK